VLVSRGGKTPIMSEKSGVEHFSQGDIHGVVSGEIVAQSPYPGQKEAVRMTPNGKVHEVVKGGLSPFRSDLPCHCKSANDLGDLDIEQVRRMKGLGRSEKPDLDRCA